MRRHGCIGDALLRVEDERFLRGQGRFVDDMPSLGAHHCAMVRAPHAHARFTIVDTAEALSVPGVVAVLTGADMAADGVGPMRCIWPVGVEPPRWAMARGTVRHVGEIVAVVIAADREAATLGAERVRIDWDIRQAVLDTGAPSRDAMALHEEAPDNIAFRREKGDRDAVERVFAAAAHVVALTLRNNRLIGAAIEPRAVMAVPDVAADRVTLYASTQVPHHIRRLVAEQLGLRESQIRVVAPDVGGGFGYKGKHYPEEAILAWAARRLAHPLRWSATRAESFCADYQGRDHRTNARLAIDAQGRFLAIDVRTVANLGAYVSTFGAAIPSSIYASLLTGVYLTPMIYAEIVGMFTNTVPTDAYRGAGRPEACYVVERLADRAAAALGMDRLEIRRRNLVPLARMPYTTPAGPTYDSGDFRTMLDSASAAAHWSDFEDRRSAAQHRGKLRGIGLACYIESSGVAPSAFAGKMGARLGFYETATLRVEADGGVQVLVGTHSHGQGHATTFAQIVADRLGIPVETVTVFEGDTDQTPYGTGTFGSRSISVGGSAIHRATERILDKARAVAAYVLEAPVERVRFSEGQFEIVGTNRRMPFAKVAQIACVAHGFPHGAFEPGLQDTAAYDPPNFAFSNGVHVAEVEVDPETGVTQVVAYCAIDDIGTIINPMIAEGQVHGGVAQGLGQSLFEWSVYDADGQLLTGSFMDYGIARASDMPPIHAAFDEAQPCRHNPLGAKGCGEAGAIAAPTAIVSAVLDALAPRGIVDVDMPLTSGQIWQALSRERHAP